MGVRGPGAGASGGPSGLLGTLSPGGRARSPHSPAPLPRRLVTAFSTPPRGSSRSLWHSPPSAPPTGPASQRAGRAPPAPTPGAEGGRPARGRNPPHDTVVSRSPGEAACGLTSRYPGAGRGGPRRAGEAGVSVRYYSPCAFHRVVVSLGISRKCAHSLDQGSAGFSLMGQIVNVCL